LKNDEFREKDFRKERKATAVQKKMRFTISGLSDILEQKAQAPVRHLCLLL
jgi:hypothetical protein